MLSRLLPLAAGSVLVLSACQLAVDVDVLVEPDGSGTVTVTAEADPALVEQLPARGDELLLDDLDNWRATGPTPTPDGGLVVTLTSTFDTPAELADRLNRIGPPLAEFRAGQAVNTDLTITTTALAGRLQLADGFASFADADLIETVGGIPFAARLEGVDPADALRVTLRVAMPGETIETNGAEVEPGVFVWEAPLDGGALEVAASTAVRESERPGWAGPLSTVSMLALIIWVLLSLLFIGFVLRARQRRRARRRRPPPRRAPADA